MYGPCNNNTVSVLPLSQGATASISGCAVVDSEGQSSSTNSVDGQNLKRYSSTQERNSFMVVLQSNQ